MFRFQVHLTDSGAQPPKLNTSASARRFFFATALDRADLARRLARVHYPRKLPRVLSPVVARLLEAAPGPGLKCKAALSIDYGADLRAGEVVMPRVSDIESKRMLIRVEVVPVQGRQGPARNALAAAARAAQGLVAAVPLARLAVPRPRSAAADHGTAAQPRLPYGGVTRSVGRRSCGRRCPRSEFAQAVRLSKPFMLRRVMP
jgi:hypothetical protein